MKPTVMLQMVPLEGRGDVVSWVGRRDVGWGNGTLRDWTWNEMDLGRIVISSRIKNKFTMA